MNDPVEAQGIFQHEAAFQSLVEQLPTSTFVYKAALDDIASTIYVGPQVEALGFTHREWLEGGDFWSRQLHPDDRARVLAAFMHCRESHEPFVCEYRLYTRDGEVRWFRDHAVVVRDDRGTPLFYQGVMTDITGRKQAEEELALYRDHLEDIVAERTAELRHEIARRRQVEENLWKAAEEVCDLYDNAPCGYHSLDKDGVIVRINNTELSWLGYSRNEVTGKRYTDFVTPEGINIFNDNFPRLKERGWVRDIEFELLRKDGSVIPVLLSATAIVDENGDYLMSRSMLFDITERKKMELALLAGEERYRKQYKGIPVPTYTWSRRGEDFVLTDYNDAGEAITQGGITRFIGFTLKDMFPDRPDIIADTTTCFVEKRQLRREFWYTMRSTGERRYLDVTYVFLPGDQVLVHTEDLTDRKLAEEELLRYRDRLEELVKERTADLEKEAAEHRRTAKELKDSYDMVSGLLTRIEHARDEEREKTVRDIHDDVGQLLTAISYDIAYLEKGLPDELADLRAITKNSTSLVNKVVERIQRIAAGLHPPLLDTLDIVAAMEWRAIEFEKETGINCSVTSEPAVIKLDKNLSHELFKVFTEALTNVARHSEATKVTVSMTKKNKKVDLEIRDNGRGFSLETVPLKKVTGLAGMKARLRPWGGTLTIKSGEAKGTTISASLLLGR